MFIFYLNYVRPIETVNNYVVITKCQVEEKRHVTKHVRESMVREFKDIIKYMRRQITNYF